MIVASCTFDGKTKKRGRRRVNEVFQTLVLVIGIVVGFVVPGSEHQEPGSGNTLHVSIGNLVASQLLNHKLIVGHVGVQRVDDPVAILPGEGFVLITFVPAGFRVTNQVQPVPPPSFSVVR